MMSSSNQRQRDGGRSNTTFKEYEHGYAPVVPPSLYRLLQEAAGYIKHLETNKNDMCAQLDLEGIEGCVESVATYHKDNLPRDWKYDRATAGKWQRIPYFYLTR